MSRTRRSFDQSYNQSLFLDGDAWNYHERYLEIRTKADDDKARRMSTPRQYWHDVGRYQVDGNTTRAFFYGQLPREYRRQSHREIRRLARKQLREITLQQCDGVILHDAKQIFTSYW